MDPLEFIASLVSSVAWPVAVVVLALTFRKKLRKIIGAVAQRIADMTEFSGPGSVNAKFGERLREVTDVTSKMAPPSDSGTSLPDDAEPQRKDPAESMVYTSPRHAVLEAYIPLEKAAYDLVERSGGQRKDLQMMLRNPVAALRKLPFVTRDIASSAAELRQLRNQAAHQETFEVEPDVVLDYIFAARDLTSMLHSISRELTSGEDGKIRSTG
ncbi:hypothetical protein [Pseudarthrobacter sp. MM222]|uniref:hypothetical protein n=1 Tax=Pseudarthrobacter sp. MM222 TaxID=3018929 RepID=UPI002220009E|nr:hypothetical protein [Pseudarthrobacter sp. MM222]